MGDGITPAPLHLGTPDRTLFGWYHAPSGLSPRTCGIVVCNPIGDDYIRAHRTLRHLAERLAGCGFPVLRFDFHGTGDSSGDERLPGRTRAWLADINNALDELRAISGVSEISVVGIRLGATMAMAAAAQRSDIDSLVLWSPYLDGKAFIAESTKLHQMHRLLEPQSFVGGPQENPDGHEALGFLFTHELIDDLGGIDLLSLRRRPAPRVLVLSPGNAAGENRLTEHLGALGTACEHRQIAGPKFLTMTPHRSVVPTEELEVIAGWLSEQHPAVSATAEAIRREVRAAIPGSELQSERPIHFGQEDHLFGVLVTPPAEVANRELPAIVLMNAGTVHRIGPHRHSVAMARRWARLGFHVLRVDLSGIGDSPAAEGTEENLCYPRDLMKDLDETMNMLSGSIGARRFILIGLCSGGDIAFKRALTDPRVAGVVMMNPRTFCVHDLALINTYQQARYYQGSIFRKEKWLKLLKGGVDLRRAARLVIPKIRDLALRRLRGLVQRVRRKGEGMGQVQQELEVPACLRRMADQGVDTFLLVTAHDPGVDYVDARYGEQMRALHSVSGFRREDIHGTDHTFTSLWAQQHVSDIVTYHLKTRYRP